MVMILTKTRENKGADSVTCRTELVSFVKSLLRTLSLPRTLLCSFVIRVFFPAGVDLWVVCSADFYKAALISKEQVISK